MVVREKDDEYIYSGQLITMKNDFPEEETRRIRLAWRAYGRHSDIGKESVLSNERHLINACGWC